ncbi:hypothetical protein PAXINDRAFT_18604 [Paxillus involutus ATCC 200175]|uniref:Uncharacterized protein n=1 Tax=Paxillus involutus ATCC 200175 TaxID=664439 RepID=A0A0C9TB32_PAXIN|nr:hypothetical protein PAXINDRAFT_18604 [Paxillus involutus ATCC 200175]
MTCPVTPQGVKINQPWIAENLVARNEDRKLCLNETERGHLGMKASASLVKASASLVKALTTLNGIAHRGGISDLLDSNFNIVYWLHIEKSKRFDELIFDKRKK